MACLETDRKVLLTVKTLGGDGGIGLQPRSNPDRIERTPGEQGLTIQSEMVRNRHQGEG
jgi:hypothetical protein